MSGNIPTPVSVDALAVGRSSTSPFITVFETRDPTTNDVNYKIQQRWFNTSTNSEFILTAFSVVAEVKTAVWNTISGTEAVETFTTNLGGPVSPDSDQSILVNASVTTFTDGTVANTLKTEVQGTNHALFIGRGTGTNTAATTLGVATNGQIPIGSTGADPTLAVPSNGNNITWTTGAGSLTANVTGTTNHAVQIGNASGSLSSVSVVGATGTVFAGTTGADPAFTATPTVTSITFGAGSALSKYIQAGSWTPVLQFGGASTGITYVNQIGEYTRIGNLVYLKMLLEISSKGSATGAATIAGFPITAANSGEQTMMITSTTNITYDAGYQYTFLDTAGTPDTIFDVMEGGSAGYQAISDTKFANNTRLQFNGFYFADGV